jgi:hypothetical protein
VAERGLTNVVNVPGEFIPRCGCTADVIAAELGDITIAGKPLTEGHPLIVSIGEEDGAVRVTLNLSAGHRVRVRQRSPEWKPIETAPKDGTQVLVLSGALNMRVGWYDQGSWIYYQKYGGVRVVILAPTRWMALPMPPSAEGDRS